MFFMAGSSGGLTETFPWYRQEIGLLYPQKTIFDQLSEAGAEWRLYYQDTPWETFMETLAHHPESLRQLDEFFIDAAEGKLPSFSYINPRGGINVTTGHGSNDMHPDHDVALGEALYKQVYEALRASPQWNETLFVLTFDEHGGFYDHVPPPTNIPPPGDGRPAFPDTYFDFRRGGIRIPTVLISPWLKPGPITTPPPSQKPANNSVYELTSIIATARKLLQPLAYTPPLTGRDAWAATFEHLFDELDAPRTDCPQKLPPAPPPASGVHSLGPSIEATLLVNELQSHIMEVADGLVTERSGTWSSVDVNLFDNDPRPTRQGEFSEWAARRHQHHRHVTLLWKASKAWTNVSVEVRPTQEKHHKISDAWHLDRGIRDGLTVETFSMAVENVSVCLDSGEPVRFSRVRVSVATRLQPRRRIVTSRSNGACTRMQRFALPVTRRCV